MTPRGMSIQEAYRLYRDGNLLVNRKYQRKLVWAEVEKIALIDTILNNFPIPLILLAERAKLHGPGKYEILDGVQRLNAIFGFIENFYAIDGKYFDVNEATRAKQLANEGIFDIAAEDLPKLEARKCADFLDYQLAVTIFQAYDDEEITEIFGRINASGRQLSNQERRQAGVVNVFGDFVRKIASEIRGDASKDILLLSEMPEISIESSRLRQKYGLVADDIFWVRQGILWNSQLRESEDEELLADIITSILLGEPFKRSKEALNELYDNKSDLYKKIENALVLYPEDDLNRDIKHVFSILKSMIEDYDSSANALRNIVVTNNRNPIKTSFYAIFMAFYELLVHQQKSPTDSRSIMAALKNHQSKMVLGTHYITKEDREANINVTVGLIHHYFVYVEPPILKHGPGLILDFENSLRRSKIETPRYEFKQGLLELVENPSFRFDLLDRIINTICGMANLGPMSEGFIYIGVADDKKDAERIKSLYGQDYLNLSDNYVVGIDREAKKLGLTLDKYMEKIVEHIRGSKLSDPLKTQVLSQVDTIIYKHLTVVRIRIPPQSEVSFVDNTAYIRESSQTNVAEGKKLLSINSLFG